MSSSGDPDLSDLDEEDDYSDGEDYYSESSQLENQHSSKRSSKTHRTEDSEAYDDFPCESEDAEPGGELLDVATKADLLTSEAMAQLWHFATDERRTKSLANRVSDLVRGEWLTEDLVVQGIQGWGARAMRLLCVVAETPDSRNRLRLFFEKDRRNVAGRLKRVRDPLENENRVLVKIAYGESTSGWVTHEQRVLADLDEMPGVPLVMQWIYFQDVGSYAVVYRYSSALNLQQRLETGVLISEEDLHYLACFLLQVIQGAHSRGWIHCDLRPCDVLLDFDGVTSLDDAPDHRLPLICSWGHAVRVTDSVDLTVPQALIDIVQRLPVRPARGPQRLRTIDLEEIDEVGSPYLAVDGSTSRVLGVVTKSNNAGGQGSRTSLDLPTGAQSSTAVFASASLYSAPEQLVSAFVGKPCVSPATDVYRVAAVCLMALRAKGPLGAPGRSNKRQTEQHVDVLRRIGHQCVMRRAEGKTVDKEPWSPTDDDQEHMVNALKGLLAGKPDTGGLLNKELAPWFRQCLIRDAAERIQRPDDALDVLDDVWSVMEERLIEEARKKKQAEDEKELIAMKEEEDGDSELSSQASATRTKGRVKRIVFEPPPELAEMTVL
eukprot:TRINITY_DN9760_c1_g2_i1.p1 TRINITY_DN9760_c1_g2~~TRINITY_DN9760_c1_g2_i1.p1  ORF type:complete len:605 (-),score=136.94 TRINITY_DN9760_c1_g2_i1:59-1873(-)